MANRYREWLHRAEALGRAPEPRLADVPPEMFTDVHNSLSRLWTWQKTTLAAATGAGGDSRVAAELQTAIPRMVAICYELDRWGMEQSEATEIPDRNAMVVNVKPPQHTPVLFWPADDGGVIVAVAGEDGDGLVTYGGARHIAGSARLDDRFFTALELATSQWQLLNEREARAGLEVVATEPPEPTSVTTDTEREQRASRWAVWLEGVTVAPPAELVSVLGGYPEDPGLRGLWRHAAMRIGRYRERYGVMPPTDILSASRSNGDDHGRRERLKIAESVNALLRATHDLGGGDGPSLG